MDGDLVEQSRSLSRRDFLKTSALVGFSLSSMLTNAHYLLDQKYNLPPETKERYLVQTDDGYKVGLLLGQHGAFNEKSGKIEEGQRITVIRNEDLYIPVGAFFLDAPADYLDPRVTGEIVENSLRKSNQVAPNFYRIPVEYGIAHNIPFIFGDITLRGISIDDLHKYSGDLELKGSLTALTTMIAEGGRQIAENYMDFFKKSMTRRDILKLLVGGSILSTIYFSSPAYIHLVRTIGIKPGSIIDRDFQAIFTDLIHPDNYVVVMRNIVWALNVEISMKEVLYQKKKL